MLHFLSLSVFTDMFFFNSIYIQLLPAVLPVFLLYPKSVQLQQPTTLLCQK